MAKILDTLRSPLQTMYTEIEHAVHNLNETDSELNSAQNPQERMAVLQKQYDLVKSIEYRCRLRYNKIVNDARAAKQEVTDASAGYTGRTRRQIKEPAQLKRFDQNKKTLSKLFGNIKDFITKARRAVLGRAIRRNELVFR